MFTMLNVKFINNFDQGMGCSFLSSCHFEFKYSVRSLHFDDHCVWIDELMNIDW